MVKSITSEKDSLTKLIEALSKPSRITQVEKKQPSPSRYSGAVKTWLENANKDLFFRAGYKPDKIPTKSTLLIGRTGIGKSSLTRVWQEKLAYEIECIKADKEEMVESGRMKDYIWALKERSFYSISEAFIRKHINDITSDRDELLDKIVDYKNDSMICKWRYLFIDDLFEKENYTHSGKQIDNEFLMFIKSLLEILIQSEGTIVIATTNNYPSRILFSEKELADMEKISKEEKKEKLESNKFLRRVRDVFSDIREIK